MLVFPSITKAGLGIGGQYGTGAMREGNRTVGYYNIIAGNFGFQIGAQTFSQAYFFNTLRPSRPSGKPRVSRRVLVSPPWPLTSAPTAR